jgi:methylphosphotriester-DNA--protein-cysteine methyltransferase
MTEVPSEYAWYRQGRIFGKLDCRSGMRMRKESRIFFASLEDAVAAGYRPCKNCRPIDDEGFGEIKHLVPEDNLQDFYNRHTLKKSLRS